MKYPLTAKQKSYYRYLYKKAHNHWPPYDLAGITEKNYSWEVARLHQVITEKFVPGRRETLHPLVRAKQMIDGGFHTRREVLEATHIKPYHYKRLKAGETAREILKSCRGGTLPRGQRQPLS